LLTVSGRGLDRDPAGPDIDTDGADGIEFAQLFFNGAGAAAALDVFYFELR